MSDDIWGTLSTGEKRRLFYSNGDDISSVTMARDALDSDEWVATDYGLVRSDAITEIFTFDRDSFDASESVFELPGWHPFELPKRVGWSSVDENVSR